MHRKWYDIWSIPNDDINHLSHILYFSYLKIGDLSLKCRTFFKYWEALWNSGKMYAYNDILKIAFPELNWLKCSLWKGGHNSPHSPCRLF